MQTRQLGHTNLHIVPIVFGGNVFGWTIDEAKSHAILDEFTQNGFNAIDTADVYSRWAPGNSGGESETIIGNWLSKSGKRSDIILMTKVGSDMGDGKKGLKKSYIIQAAEASLKRLKTDYIDLYQTHFDEESTPVEETLAAYDELIKSGKVRWIGTSNMSPDRIKESLKASDEAGLPRYETLQPHYNLYARDKFETQYEALAVKENLGVITYFSLESGFLSGKYRSKDDLGKSPRGGDMDKYFDKRGLAILDALDTVSAKHKTQPAVVSLAWLLNRPSVAAPIVSATKSEQLSSLFLAPTLELDTDDINLLNTASAY